MGRAISEKKVAKDSKKGPKLVEEAAKKNKLLPKYALAAEALLAAYPDEDGKPVYVGDKDGAAELLEPGNILGRSTPKNTEMLSRPPDSGPGGADRPRRVGPSGPAHHNVKT